MRGGLTKALYDTIQKQDEIIKELENRIKTLEKSKTTTTNTTPKKE